MFKSNRQVYVGVMLVLLALLVSGIMTLAQSDEAPSPEENKALVTAYLEAISGKEKPAALQDEYIADSDQVLKDHIVMFEVGFPLYELLVDDMIAEADKVAVRLTFRGTHLGEFFGIAPTNVEVEIPILIIYRIEDGMIAEHWMQADVMGLMQQLGALPAPTE